MKETLNDDKASKFARMAGRKEPRKSQAEIYKIRVVLDCSIHFLLSWSSQNVEKKSRGNFFMSNEESKLFLTSGEEKS